MAYCSECNQECEVTNVDFGIGSYEYWGAPGNDVQICTVSECCEADAYADKIENDNFDEELPECNENRRFRYKGDPISLSNDDYGFDG